MIIAVTATRTFLTQAQKDWMSETLDALQPTTLHHGGCTGGDEYAHKLALHKGISRIVVHPPIKTDYMMTPDWNHPNVVVLPADDYHSRDRTMVLASNLVLGAPNTEHRPHSGTWYTLDFAKKVRRHRIICMPDGKVI